MIKKVQNIINRITEIAATAILKAVVLRFNTKHDRKDLDLTHVWLLSMEDITLTDKEMMYAITKISQKHDFTIQIYHSKAVTIVHDHINRQLQTGQSMLLVNNGLN